MVLCAGGILTLCGCASQPVTLRVDEGSIIVDGVASIQGKGLVYTRGVLQTGEAAATWDGDVSLGINPAPTE